MLLYYYMPDGNIRAETYASQKIEVVTSEQGYEVKQQLLEFCHKAETALNEITKLDKDAAMLAVEKFKRDYALPLRMTVRAINDHHIPREEFLSMIHEQAGSLVYFIEHRASHFSKSDSAEIAIALNHVVGRFHEIGAI